MNQRVGAQHVALNLLTRREHSQQELRQKLKIRKFAQEEIEAALQQLATQELQSDMRFAESYAQMRIRKGYGPQRISRELCERGVDKELIDRVIRIFDNEFWLEQIHNVRQKKFGKKIANNLTEKVKQMRFLQYRGFTLEQIKKK